MKILVGDVREQLRTLPDGMARCCVTSPPYWGLRDYGHPGQLGLEATPEAYVAAMVEVFREVWRVLADDGTLWVNIGDSYCAPNGRSSGGTCKRGPNSQLAHMHGGQEVGVVRQFGRSKPKDLIGIPWRLAFALQADGWYLRQDIIWHKPNPMPESVTDRCTKAHEYLFLLSKSERYFFDSEAMREPGVIPAGTKGAKGSAERQAQKGVNARPPEYKIYDGMRNRRSVWTVPTVPYSGAHFATFPEELPERCIKAGSAIGDTVLDPFLGSGTTIAVARKLGRDGVGIEINPEYAALARDRIGMAEKPATYVQEKDVDAPLFTGATP